MPTIDTSDEEVEEIYHELEEIITGISTNEPVIIMGNKNHEGLGKEKL